MRKEKLVVAGVLVVILVVCISLFFRSKPTQPETEFRTFSAGNEEYPIWLLYSLSHDRRSMMDWLEYYGFRPGQSNPLVPLGMSFKKGRVLNVINNDKIGFTCSACHTGTFQYNDEFYTIDGMPSMVDPEEWLILVINTLEETLQEKNGQTHADFLKRAFLYMTLGPKSNQEASESITAFDSILEESVNEVASRILESEMTQEHYIHEVAFLEGFHDQVKKFNLESSEQLKNVEFDMSCRSNFYKQNYPEFSLQQKSRTVELYQGNSFYEAGANLVNEIREFIKKNKVVNSMEESYRPGLCRDAAWGTIDVMVGEVNGNFDAPVSVPDLFNGSNQWHHVDGNIGSKFNRNLLQALALGRKANFVTGQTEITYQELLTMENALSSIEAPRWNEYFPKLDKSLVKAGQRVYEQKRYTNYKAYSLSGALIPSESPVSCADCHQTPERKEDQLFYDVGTSPVRWKYYYENPHLLGVLSERLGKVSDYIIDRASQDGFSIEREDATLHPRQGYVARPLKGLWATSPYLHNGSVPDLLSLFMPYEDRPKSFWLGNLQFNTTKVGYYTEERPQNVYATQFLEGDIPGNSAKGHEFGAELSPDERNSLLEYLKSL